MYNFKTDNIPGAFGKYRKFIFKFLSCLKRNKIFSFIYNGAKNVLYVLCIVVFKLHLDMLKKFNKQDWTYFCPITGKNFFYYYRWVPTSLWCVLGFWTVLRLMDMTVMGGGGRSLITETKSLLTARASTLHQLTGWLISSKKDMVETLRPAEETV